MDQKKLALAIVLMAGVAIVPNLLFRPSSPPPGIVLGDSIPGVDTAPEAPEVAPAPAPAPDLTAPPAALAPAARVDTVIVESKLYRLGLDPAGGALVYDRLNQYQSLVDSIPANVQLVRPEAPLFTHALVLGGDTLPFDRLSFASSRRVVDARDAPADVTLRGRAAGLSIDIDYRFFPDTYRYEVRGTIRGLPATGTILAIGLGSGLRSAEANIEDDFRRYAVVTKTRKTESLSFGKVKPGETETLPGPFEWAAVKSKYFLAAVLALHEDAVPLGGAVVHGGPRTDGTASHASALVTIPVSQSGTFGYDVYVGPQETDRLRAIGHDLEDVNPYGWILSPIIGPIAVAITKLLVAVHKGFNLGYGWVLILFGLAIRVLLWPLNQKAMESQVRMQAVQPQLTAIREQYKNDPQRAQQEQMKLFKEHGVNPLGGCLPMLLPMPVLFALFFVFSNTIEFRGVPFLWLPDLSAADPLYITPLVMGVSMFALLKLGQIGVPPNPQAKMMMYFMPVFMTVVLLRFASGLNVYYAAQNLFSLPQQWLIARKRMRTQGAKAASPG